MLCSRSASLTSSTRMSSDMASRNLRRFSAARSFSVWASIFESLVTPSTSRATSSPKSFWISSVVVSVSSIVVVQQRRYDRLVVEEQLCQNTRNFNRMAEVRIAARALRLPWRATENT